MNAQHMDLASLLADSLARYAADHYGFAQRRAHLAQPQGFSEAAWRDYAQQGWLALRLPEALGGIAADAAAIGALMEASGRWLLMEPLLASAVLGAGALLRAGNAAQRERWLPRIADGSARLAYAGEPGALRWHGGQLTGALRCVLHGDAADALVVAAAGDSGTLLCLVETAGIERRTQRLVDGRGAADFEFAGTPAERLDAGTDEDAALLQDEAAVALCAEALGCMQALLAATREHLLTRTQFGKPLAANQALAHRLVELHLLTEETRALTREAQRALDAAPTQRARTVSGARVFAIDALRHAANEAVQLHGGVGITDELAVSHHYRRAMVNAALFGGREPHFARFAQACAA